MQDLGVNALLYKQVINADAVKILLDELHYGRLIRSKVPPIIKHFRLPQRPVPLSVVAVHA